MVHRCFKQLVAGLVLGLQLAAALSVKQDFFTLPTPGQRLTGRALAIKSAKSPFGCARKCMRSSGCSAFSFRLTSGDCQLMRSSDITGTVPDSDYTTILRKVSCDDKPCRHGGTCYPIPTSMNDVIAYACLCPCGRCGYNCDNLHFGQMSDACIYMFNAGYQKVNSRKECMLFCWETPGCKSADYISAEGDCWLNSVTDEEEPLTIDCDKWYPGVTFLFFNCTCDE